LFHQLAKMTRERNALVHDDRADALEGAVRYWQALLQQNQDDAVKRQRDKEYAELIRDPLNHTRYGVPSTRKGLFAKYRK
jgi:hypothetical protein